MMNKFFDVLVVGAGIAGLMASSYLNKAGLTVHIVEKSRGFGGRMAFRKTGDYVWDHGAQYLTARSAVFARHVSDWVGQGSLGIWFNRYPGEEKDQPRFYGVHSMSGLPDALARESSVSLLTKIDLIRRENGHWVCTSDTGVTFRSAALLLTQPAPQILELLAKSSFAVPAPERVYLQSVSYAPCLTLLLKLSGPSGIPKPGIAQDRTPEAPVAWLADNHIKGISPKPSMTLHSSPEFAARYINSSSEVYGPLMLNHAQKWIQSPVLEWTGHRWLYAMRLTPSDTAARSCISIPAERLFFAGDSFGECRIEGAALSGIEAASSIIKTLSGLKR